MAVHRRSLAEVDWLILIGIIGPHDDGIAHSRQLKQIQAMNDARTRLIHLRRGLRQIIGMVVISSTGVFLLLVDAFMR